MRILIFAAVLFLAHCIKVTVINDVHLDLEYKALPLNNLCRLQSQSKNIEVFEDRLKLGTWGCDSPFELVETMYDEIEKQDSLDLIIMSGDYAAHGLAAYPNQKDHYEQLKEVHSKLFEFTK